MTLLHYNPIRWTMMQPNHGFSLDAKCLLWTMTFDEEVFSQSSLFKVKINNVLSNKLPDGSFRSKYGGNTGSVIWTAEAIRWLLLSGDSQFEGVIDEALRWLIQCQNQNGSWKESLEIPWKRDWYTSPFSAVWITSAVLQSIFPFYEMDGHNSDFVLLALEFIQGTRETLFKLINSKSLESAFYFFGLDPFSVGVLMETLDIYNVEIGEGSILVRYLESLQKDDGSWGESVDVTQCVTQTLLRLKGKTDTCIDKALEYLRKQQNTDGSWSHQSGQVGDWTLTAYTIRLFVNVSRLVGITLCNDYE